MRNTSRKWARSLDYARDELHELFLCALPTFHQPRNCQSQIAKSPVYAAAGMAEYNKLFLTILCRRK